MSIFNKKFKKHAGFTLIEIVIAAFIFLVVVLISTAVFGYTIGTKSKSAVLRNNQRTARYILEAVGRDIKYADQSGIYDNGTANNICGFIILNDGGIIATEADTIITPRSLILLFYKKESDLYAKVYRSEDIAGRAVLSVHDFPLIAPVDPTPGIITWTEIANADYNELVPPELALASTEIFSGRYAKGPCDNPDLDPDITGTDYMPYVNIELTIQNREGGTVKREYQDTIQVSTTVTSRNYTLIFH